MNSSATGGYLTPTSDRPIEGDELDALLQAMVVGILGLAGDLVRPRWQPTVPKQPAASVNWCAIGVTIYEGSDYPVEEHTAPTTCAPGGRDVQTRWETVTVLASLYGPGASGNARALRDGLYVAQNREALQAEGLDVIDAGTVTNASALVNQNWIRRYDIPLRLRAKVSRTYKVLHLLSAPDTVVTN